MAAADGTRSFRAARYPFQLARELARELQVELPTAITLARRGFTDPGAAREFLSAGVIHDPGEFPGLERAAQAVREAIDKGSRITVFGDFDVDGVCATAIVIGALRRLGAECDWMIPDRLTEGYGLSEPAVERLAARGTGMLITVDNGIAAAGPVAAAVERGMQVVVTDHHRPPEALPACAILHPGVSGYTHGALCGAAVAWKLAAGMEPDRAAEEDLDLVALATIADLVELRGENRSLVRRGLEIARLGRRPGLRALVGAAGCQIDRLDEQDLGFRLGPRINAAGRLYRADAGVELFLTADRDRAAEVAEELNRANFERRAIQQRVESAALQAHREQPEELRESAAVVLAGRDWHPGVVGIVASRLVEEHGKPALAISIAEDGTARGSGRSVPGFDLVAALGACAEHLDGFGGHAAAAGIQLGESRIPAFAAAFAEHAGRELGPSPAPPQAQVDAIVTGSQLGLELAEDLRAMAPFGIGNPRPLLLVPNAAVTGQQAMGDDGRHLRFTLASGGYRARGVAFGSSRLVPDDGDLADLAICLERNEWNGAVEPRVEVKQAWPLGADGGEPHRPQIDDREWWERLEKAFVETDSDTEPEFGGASGAEPESAVGAAASRSSAGPEIAREPAFAEREPRAEACEHPPGATHALIAELLSAGERVVALSADAARRSRLATGPTGLERFAEDGASAIVTACDSRDRLERELRGRTSLLLTEHECLARAGRLSGEGRHVVVVDPPASREEEVAAAQLAGESSHLHLTWGEGEREFALRVLADRFALRPALAELYRGLRDTGPVAGPELRGLVVGNGPYPRDPEACGRLGRILVELELAEAESSGGVRQLRVVSSVQADLEDSPTFRRSSARYERGRAFLERARHQLTSGR